MDSTEIIEKIRAEIERHKELFKEACDCGSYYACARRDEANEILEVLSDLEKSEKPIEGLEEEIDKVYLPNRVVGYVQGIGKILLGREAFANIARHFAKWQKEQMMKDAVEGIAVINANAKEDGFGYVRSEYIHDDVLRGLGRFKIIIVKED